MMARQTDVLEVVCWCEAKVTRLPRTEVLAGRTVSCGAPGCVPPPAPARPKGRV